MLCIPLVFQNANEHSAMQAVCSLYSGILLSPPLKNVVSFCLARHHF